MTESITNVYDRIKTIKKGIKNFKPKAVKDFEKMYNESISKKTETKKNFKNENIHPYLKEKQISEKALKHDLDKINLITSKNQNFVINKAIKDASKKHKISEDLIRAVIKIESNYHPHSVSKAWAMGLMQLMPKTSLELGVEKPFDIHQNIDGGTRYLRMMLNKYNNDLDKALAAYNAGPHRVDQANGVPDITVTKNYIMQIKKILFK